MSEQCFGLVGIHPEAWRQEIVTEHTDTDCRCLELYYGFLVRCLSWRRGDCIVKA